MISGFFLPTIKVYSWWDTGLYTTLDYIVTTTNNKNYSLSPQLLLPYEDLNRGKYSQIIDTVTVPRPSPWGGGDYHFWKLIENLDDVELIRKKILEKGKNNYNQEKKLQFEDLLVRSLTNYNRRGLKKSFISFLPQIPPHYLSMDAPRTSYYQQQAPIKKLYVVYRVNFYNRRHNKVYQLEKYPIYEFNISQM